MTGLFCRISSLLWGSFAQETCNFEEPTNSSQVSSGKRERSIVVFTSLFFSCVSLFEICTMGWLWLVGSITLYVSFAKEPYKRHNIPQKHL